VDGFQSAIYDPKPVMLYHTLQPVMLPKFTKQYLIIQYQNVLQQRIPSLVKDGFVPFSVAKTGNVFFRPGLSSM
jgi:hypothetical protein